VRRINKYISGHQKRLSIIDRRILEIEKSFCPSDEQKMVNEQKAIISKKRYVIKKLQKEAISKLFRHTIFMPLSIAFRMLSYIFKILGYITAIGLPYGVYLLYKIIRQLQDGADISDAVHNKYMYILLVFPFITFFINCLFTMISKHLSDSVEYMY